MAAVLEKRTVFQDSFSEIQSKSNIIGGATPNIRGGPIKATASFLKDCKDVPT